MGDQAATPSKAWGSRARRAAAITAFVLLVSAGPAAAASISVSPASVPAGGTVTV